LLFLLKDVQGQALLMAEAASKAEADKYGRTHVPDFCGESIEIDTARFTEAEQFRGLRKVRVVKLAGSKNQSRTRTTTAAPTRTIQHILVWGPKLPEEVEEADLLTPEDHRDLTLDHIARTSTVVAHIEIIKRT
jgi:hypothetical protein